MAIQDIIIKDVIEFERIRADFMSNLNGGHFKIRQPEIDPENPDVVINEARIVMRSPRVDGKPARNFVIPHSILIAWYRHLVGGLDEQTRAQVKLGFSAEFENYFKNSLSQIEDEPVSLDKDTSFEQLRIIRDEIQRKEPARLQAFKEKESLSHELKDIKRVKFGEDDSLITDALMSAIVSNNLQISKVKVKFSVFDKVPRRVIIIPPDKKHSKPRYMLAEDFDHWYHKKLRMADREQIDSLGYKKYFKEYSKADRSLVSLIDVQNKRVKTSGTTLESKSLSSPVGSSLHQIAARSQGLYSSEAALPISPTLLTHLSEEKDNQWVLGDMVVPNTASGKCFRTVQALNNPAHVVRVYDKKVGIDGVVTPEKAAMAAQIAAKAVAGVEAIIVRNERNDMNTLIVVFEQVIKLGKLPIVESVAATKGIPVRTQDQVIAGLSNESRAELNTLLANAPADVKDNYYHTTRSQPPVPAEPEKTSSLGNSSK